MAYKDKTPEQQQNFKILHDGLVGMYGDKRTDPHFKMKCYQIDGDEDCVSPSHAFTSHSCYTAACVLGHGPIFGIKGDDAFLWRGYSLVSFGMNVWRAEWRFLFSENWSNDIQEAIARLRMYINGFDPENEIWSIGSRYSV